MPSRLLTLILPVWLGAMLLAFQAEATVIYKADHENGQFPPSPLEVNAPATGYAVQIASTPAIGNYGSRFELLASDPDVANGARTQLAFYPGWVSYVTGTPVLFGGITPNHCNPCPDDWFTISVYIPTDYPTDCGYEGGNPVVACGSSDVINEQLIEWHNFNDPNEYGRSAVLALYTTTGGNLIWETRYSATAIQTANDGTIVRLSSEPTPKGQWIRFVGHVHWAYDTTGRTEIWRQSGTGQPVKIVDRTGPNCYNDQSRIHLWWGIYKWPWTGSGTTSVSTRVVYLDELKIGDANSSLAEMLGTPTTPVTSPPAAPQGLRVQ